MKKFTDIKKINENQILDIQMPLEPILKQAEESESNLIGEEPQELMNQESVPCVKLFSKLFESREMAHIYHLQVKGDPGSYATHMALGFYYESVLNLIDDLIETYTGQYELVEGYDVIDTNKTRTKDTLEYFDELIKIIKEERKCISEEDSHLQNIVDEVVALVYQTLFKLKYLK